MSNIEQRKINREKFDKLLGIDKKSSNNNTNSSNKKNDIILSDLDSNTLSNISNLSNKQLSKNDTNTTVLNDIKAETQKKTHQLKQNIQEKTQTLKKQTKTTVNRLLGRQVESTDTRKIKKEESNMLSIIIMTIILLSLIYAFYYYMNNIVLKKTKGIYLLESTKDSKNALVISQNKEQVVNKIIKKSFNKPGGMEFTYSFWIVINNMDLVNKGKWKHVFHKGERNIVANGKLDETTSIMSPGVFVHPNNNAIRIYMNVSSNPPNLLEYLDITNIPLKKWVNITFTFTEQKDTINPNNNDKLHNCLDVYINGLLKTRKEFSILPTLNEGDVWINNFGGYDGFISKLKYYDSAIGVEEIHSLLKDCPSDKSCGLDADCPPYLSNKWWFN